MERAAQPSGRVYAYRNNGVPPTGNRLGGLPGPYG